MLGRRWHKPVMRKQHKNRRKKALRKARGKKGPHWHARKTKSLTDTANGSEIIPQIFYHSQMHN